MNRIWKTLAMALAGIAAASVPAASSNTALDAYLTGLTTWSADFTQTVKDASGKKLDGRRGHLVIVRPGRFRWEAAPDGAADAVELMVADGCNLWFYDRDLEQVTVKPAKDAMQSPAMLLAGGADMRAAFRIESGGRHDGLEWTRVLPKDAQSDFREAMFGFKGKELAQLAVTDKLKQTSTLVFANVRRNAPVDPKLTQFTPPTDVDVTGKQVQCRP